jgi:predicted small metal-binding protein
VNHPGGYCRAEIRHPETDDMMILRFNEAGLDCNFEVYGKTVEEVLKKAADHARKGHDLQVTEDSLDAWRSLIREE